MVVGVNVTVLGDSKKKKQKTTKIYLSMISTFKLVAYDPQFQQI